MDRKRQHLAADGVICERRCFRAPSSLRSQTVAAGFNAPKSFNNSSACVSEISSGFSSQRNFRKSSTPAAFKVRTTSARSSRLISGNSCGARSSCSDCDQSRMQTPGAVRPARPARWSALACEFFSMSSVLIPRFGIVTRNARQPAVNHQPHAVNGDAKFRRRLWRRRLSAGRSARQRRPGRAAEVRRAMAAQDSRATPRRCG